ncbi:MAG: serine/threonine protein kinase [Candidatus Riflebacteria bacterium]|nr:serine/threonine protein kinase [Candidatus Riflebacteria bacterium]
MPSYTLIGKIGEGGMGVVYRALQLPLERPVAVKFLPASLMARPEALPRFMREVQICTRLSHPNIIKILDCGEMNGQPFYAMELLEAQTIRQLLKERGRIPVAQAVEIFHQVLEALEYCHREGLIHRDIKPHNIMVDGHNHATLMDFGLVKILDASGLTHSRQILGSPHYMSPEMLRGETVGSQADLFSLGTVVFEMLCGQKAFPGKNIRDIGRSILYGEPPGLSSLAPDCPPGLVKVIEGCMKRALEHRYQTTGEVLRDLNRFEAGGAPRGRTGETGDRPAPESPR